MNATLESMMQNFNSYKNGKAAGKDMRRPGKRLSQEAFERLDRERNHPNMSPEQYSTYCTSITELLARLDQIDKRIGAA